MQRGIMHRAHLNTRLRGHLHDAVTHLGSGAQHLEDLPGRGLRAALILQERLRSDRLAKPGRLILADRNDFIDAIQHRQRRGGVQFGHLAVHADLGADARAGFQAEVDEPADAGGEFPVGGRDDSTLAGCERLRGVKRENLGVAETAEQAPVGVARAEPRRGVDQQRDAVRVAEIAPRLSLRQRGGGAERGAGQHASDGRSVAPQRGRECRGIEVPTVALDVHEDRLEAGPLDCARGRRERVRRGEESRGGRRRGRRTPHAGRP